ncbi:ABC transporter ATP-binding protein [Pedomonas mirosovicensis]|uniref:ABC transporter ATP-binding protein n=1 Tax=Pedomonas mirosovicensis TaxID=2908641 RepID=UPI00216852F1|nr:ABC transporter ATP-binding protein [Pedomonas mirosovicensis]MCH8685722.1 ABC transporter ATP-binding protein [Pedomonas mirosovicensis]
MSVLACENLVIDAGSKRLLGPVACAFRAGEVTAVLGPNGAGKSTWLGALGGGRRVSGGTVRLGEADLAVLDPRARAQRLGFLAQGREVAWGLSVEAVVALGRLPYGRFAAAPGPEDRAAIEAAIARCGLEALRHRDILTLSGGERARALLARVLAGKPQWVLADEPLAGLDPAYQLDIVRLLRDLAAEGRGVIVTLHDLSLVGRLADRVVVLRAGQVVADGPVASVLTPDVMAATYGVAVDVLQSGDGERVVLPTRRLEEAEAPEAPLAVTPASSF